MLKIIPLANDMKFMKTFLFFFSGIYECTADNQYSVDRRSFKTDFSIAFD